MGHPAPGERLVRDKWGTRRDNATDPGWGRGNLRRDERRLFAGHGTTGNGIAAGIQLVAGTSPAVSGVYVATGDFNGDGLADVVTVDNTGAMTVSLGKGDGTFTILASVAEFPYTYIESIAVGDFNADGKLDLAVVGSADNVAVVLGNGDGTFGAAAFVATGMFPVGVVVADWNGDGLPDMAVAAEYSDEINILLGNGDGTFTAAAPVSTIPMEYESGGGGPYALVTGDFNGDGKPDLLVLSGGLMSYLNVYMGNGDGTFATSPYFAEDFWLGALAAGDFNEDGKTDLAYGEENADAVGIVLSNGDGTFSGAPSPLTGDLPGPLVVADYNGDGIADIATVTADTNHASAISVMLGNGDGTFTVQNFGTTTYSSALAAGDFNGDGFADLIYIQAITGNAAAAIEFGEETSTATGTLSAVQIVGTGTHTVQAVYAGDNNYAVSPAATLSLAAAMVSPTLTLMATPMNSTYGGQVALTATLSQRRFRTRVQMANRSRFLRG